jgi:hypothetical protein
MRPTFQCESLEGRQLMVANLVIANATALSPTVVRFQYEVQNESLPSNFQVVIYRSADTTIDAGDLVVGTVQLPGTQTMAPQTADVTLPQPLDIQPQRDYILVVADPLNGVVETNEGDNSDYFRKYVVGAVIHGQQNDGLIPSWVSGLAQAVQNQGYDVTLAFNWAQVSAAMQAGGVVFASQALAGQIGSVVSALPGIQPGDVVDLHLIGFGRGGSVVAGASSILGQAMNAALDGGYTKISLLDPFPASNRAVLDFSLSQGPIGRLTGKAVSRFQSFTNDPALVIPASVERAEVYFQQRLLTQITAPAQIEDLFMNIWGSVPVGGATAPTVYYNVQSITGSHYGLIAMYQNVVVPTLGTGGVVPIAPVATPTPPTNGGYAILPGNTQLRAAEGYERRVLVNLGVSQNVASEILRRAATIDRRVGQGRNGQAANGFDQLDRYITQQATRGLSNEVAGLLRSWFRELRALLIPPSS